MGMVYLCIKGDSMLTKFYIEIDGQKNEVPDNCIKNWDQVKCAYKRSGYDGVVRSFTSQFEFVEEVYDSLMELYLRDGVGASAVLYLYAITDNWDWKELFSAALDFSTITWSDHVLRINCSDSSLAAAINARKGTTYEFGIGTEMPVAGKLMYDRIILPNTGTLEIQGNGLGEGLYEGYIRQRCINAGKNRMNVYVVGEPTTYEKASIVIQDQNAEIGASFIEVTDTVKNLELQFNITLTANRRFWPIWLNIHLAMFGADNRFDESSYLDLGTMLHYKQSEMEVRPDYGVFSTFEALKTAYPNPAANATAVVVDCVDGSWYADRYCTAAGNSATKEWILAGRRPLDIAWFDEYLCIYRHTVILPEVHAGDCFALVLTCEGREGSILKVPFNAYLKSDIKVSWPSRGDVVDLDVIRPTDILAGLMDKIIEQKINVIPSIDTADSRIAGTYILAGESMRKLPNPRLHTSFSDFCKWMEVVFGYTYYLGDLTKSDFVDSKKFAGVVTVDSADIIAGSATSADKIYFSESQQAFVVKAAEDGKYYKLWPGSTDYNDASGKARRDIVFVNSADGKASYVTAQYKLSDYPGNPAKCMQDYQYIYFVPRSKLFNGTKVIGLTDVNDLKYTIDKELLYSTVIVGYEKQDYETEGGRGEWNFSAEYNTGLDVTSRKLELISKYRADCYGIEFQVQKRLQETTDDTEDKSIFFVHCKKETVSETIDGVLIQSESIVLDRSTVVAGAGSSSVFNGEYSPHKCLLANASYISAMKDPVTLIYASSEGNSSVEIDNVPFTADVKLQSQLFSCGQLEVSLADVETEIDPCALYQIRSGSTTYTGYLMQADVKHGKDEAIKFKLVVKNIEP